MPLYTRRHICQEENTCVSVLQPPGTARLSSLALQAFGLSWHGSHPERGNVCAISGASMGIRDEHLSVPLLPPCVPFMHFTDASSLFLLGKAPSLSE